MKCQIEKFNPINIICSNNVINWDEKVEHNRTIAKNHLHKDLNIEIEKIHELEFSDIRFTIHTINAMSEIYIDFLRNEYSEKQIDKFIDKDTMMEAAEQFVFWVEGESDIYIYWRIKDLIQVNKIPENAYVIKLDNKYVS